MSVDKCKICGGKTRAAFNIDFKRVYICEPCAATIFIQQSRWYVDQHREPYFPIMPKEFNGLKESFKKYQDK